MNTFIKSLIVLSVVVHSFECNAQTIIRNGGRDTIHANVSEACNKGLVFSFVMQMPFYTGGNEALTKSLNELVKVSTDVKGDIIVWSTINCEGKAFGFQLIRSCDTELGNKIIEALNQLQHWNAGQNNGVKVDVVESIQIEVKNKKIKVL